MSSAKLVRASAVLPWRLVTPGLGCVNASPPNDSSPALLRCHGRLVTQGQRHLSCTPVFSVQSGSSPCCFQVRSHTPDSVLTSDTHNSVSRCTEALEPSAILAQRMSGRKAVQPRSPSRLVGNHKRMCQARNGSDRCTTVVIRHT